MKKLLFFKKKKFLSSIFVALSVLLLVGCASSGPLTEEEQAERYGLSIERFREEKKAAARMNMNFDEHMKTIQGWNDMEMMNRD